MPKRKNNKNTKKNIDGYTVGHYVFGFISYIITFVFLRNTGFNFDDALFCSLIGVMFIGLFWEIIENFLIRQIKVNGKIDCLKNSLTDIIFNLIGGISAWILLYFVVFFGARL